MPAILRIFVYQTDASLSVLGQCGPYGQGAGRLGSMTPCNIMPCGPYRYILYSQLIVTHDATVTRMYNPI